MLARSFKRQAFVTSLYSRRCYTAFGRSGARSSRGLRTSVVGSGALTATLMFGWGHSLCADTPPLSREPAPTPLPQLLTSYVVYSICSIPGLVDASPALLALCTSMPGLRQLTEAFVRATFFAQFVGGDTAHACLPLIRKLRAENKGTLLVYSVEVDENGAADNARSTVEPLYKHAVQEMIRAIDVAADFEDSQARETIGSGRRTWVAVKLSGLLPDAAALARLSSYLSSLHARDAILFPGFPQRDDLAVLKLKEPPSGSPLSAQDLVDLRGLHEDLIRICARAKERNIRVTFDAEHSWYQPAIDSISFDLMREFNKVPSFTRWLPRLFIRPVQPCSQPLVYVTCQAYLRRTPEYLTQCLRDAAINRYALGIKLVRGAYHEQEAKPDSPSFPLTTNASWPPVFTNKADTDRCFDGAAAELLRAVANADGCGPWVAALFGSHNSDSCAKVLDILVNVGLARHEEDGTVKLDDRASEQVCVAQLYGMSDTLTDHLATSVKSRAPFVIKYMPYGTLSEVMPYLSRRATENKSVLGHGHAAEERKRAFDAIWRHFFGK